MMKKTYSTLAVVATLILLFSFQQKIDRRTKKALNSGYTFVPSGMLQMNGDSTSINSFIMFQGEVTNMQYREFLYDLKSRGETEKLKIARIDSTLWSKHSKYLKPYQEFYHSHPAYDNYPVVNVSKEAATIYCEWLSEKFMPNLIGDSKLKFRLPTHKEWMYAAQGGIKGAPYSWGGPYLSNSKGCQLANYVRLGAENIARDSTGKLYVEKNYMVRNVNDSFDVTAPAKSYWPNKYGLYNMNGNVAELVADKNIVVGGSWRDPGFDVRNESQKAYSGAASNVGFRVIASASVTEVPWLK